MICGNAHADETLQAQVLWRHVSQHAGCEIGCAVSLSKQLLVTKSNGIAILDLETGRQLGRIPPPTGFAATSVAESNGRVAVAWAANRRTAPGQLTLYSPTPDSPAKWRKTASFPAGFLPDMTTFSPDGRWLLSANEGEPSDDYRVDPPGSVTAVNLSRGTDEANVQQLTFERFNVQRSELRTSGVRIFGPSQHHKDGQATVAEDLEPEYIAVSADSSRAWVCLQENNAIAELDLNGPSIVAIHPLGLKSFRSVNVRSYRGTPPGRDRRRDRSVCR